MLSPSDAELVRRDRKIPGLPVLFDAEAFVRLLQTHLPDAQIETARIAYVRYKPGTNCLVLYRLESAGETFDVYAIAYGRGAADKLRKARQRPSADTPLGAGRLVFDDEAIVVSAFPNDAKIKTLLKLADARSRKRLLCRLVPERTQWWNGALRSLRYKPERRYVAQLLSDGVPQAALKFYAVGSYQAAKRGARAFHPHGALRLAGELGHSNSRRAIAFEWVGGKVLNEAYSDEEFKSETIETVGAALAELHRQQPEKLVRITRAAERRALRAVADGIGAICPHLKNRVRSIAARLNAFLANEPERARAIHGDFYANQVIVRGDRAVVLDLDEAAYGDPAADLGNFIAHLERDCRQGKLTPRAVESFRQALLDGYANSAAASGEIVERMDDRRVGTYTAIGLLRLAPRPFRDHEIDWSGAIEKILKRTEETLAAAESAGTISKQTDNQRRQSNDQDESPATAVDSFNAVGDSKMPFLTRALDLSEVERLFASRLRHLFDSDAAIRLSAIRLARHKPGRRAVIEYDLKVEHSQSETEMLALVGKARAKNLDETSFLIQRLLWLGGFGERSADNVFVPEPVAVVPELNMWLQRRVSGTTAFSPLAEPNGVELARRIAEAIYKLHETELPDAARRRHTIADELNILRERLTAVAEMKPEWQKRLQRLLAACDELAANLDAAKERTIHRDFYADQVIVSGSRLYLIDFDTLCAGDPALDVGNFLGHITEFSLRTTGDAAALRDAETAFENRYAELAGEPVRAAARGFATLTLARHIYLSTQFNERTKWTQKLLELCERRLGLNDTESSRKQVTASGG